MLYLTLKLYKLINKNMETFVIFSFRERTELLLKIGKEMLWMLIAFFITGFSLYFLLNNLFQSFPFYALLMLLTSFIPVGIASKKTTLTNKFGSKSYRIILGVASGIILFWMLNRLGLKTSAVVGGLAVIGFIFSMIIGLKSKKIFNKLKISFYGHLVIMAGILAELLYILISDNPNERGNTLIIGSALVIYSGILNAFDFSKIKEFMKMSAEKKDLEEKIDLFSSTFFLSFIGMIAFADACRLIAKFVDQDPPKYSMREKLKQVFSVSKNN